MKKKIIFSVVFLGLGYLLAMFLGWQDSQGPITIQVPSTVSIPDANIPSAQPNGTIDVAPNQIAQNAVGQAVKLNVPFVLQAPFGNWSDPIFQNACEESSVVMAMGWINNIVTISPADAQKQILDIVNFENNTFGYNADASVFDVQKIFQQYFKQQNVSVKENITSLDIIAELQKGNLVLVPAFGQALGNPNYTAPGPVEHMLVVTGYDPATKEFITNDPGTKHGANYRYNENTLFNAIWEYPSSAQTVPIPTGIFKKAMIVVQK